RRRPRKERVWRWLGRALGGFVALTVLPVVTYRFIDPPLTPLMLIRALETRSTSWSWRWVPLRAVSPALLRAVVAAEAGRFFAYLLELTWGKRRILEVYVNTVEWGDRVYGVEGAAQRYFDVPAAGVDAWQSALLAAVLPNPRRWSPAAPTPYLRARAAIIAARAEPVQLSPHRQHDAEPRFPA